MTALADVTAYRMHVPKWAVAPTSGVGAAKHGGRANRPGVEALYLALETETAVREYQCFHAVTAWHVDELSTDGRADGRFHCGGSTNVSSHRVGSLGIR